MNLSIRSRSSKRPSEDDESIYLMKWIKYVGKQKYPCLELFHHIPNGGHRHVSVAFKLKAMGVLSGVSDYFLPVPRNGYCGLYIELKTFNGKPSKTQSWFLSKIKEQGFRGEICFGWDHARDTLEDYLNFDNQIL